MKISKEYALKITLDMQDEGEEFECGEVPLVNHVDIEATWNDLRVVVSNGTESQAFDDTHDLPDHLRSQIKGIFSDIADKINSEQ